MELRTPPADVIQVHPDAWTAPFWEAAAEHRLVCARCADCGRYRLPPGPFCPGCRSQALEWPELSGRGTIFTYTVIHHPIMPALRDAVPYAVAAVALPDAPGARLVGNVIGIDSDQLAVGLEVQVEWADIREGVSVPRFRPAR